MRNGFPGELAADGPLVAFPDGINDETHERSQDAEKKEDGDQDPHADPPRKTAVILGKVFAAKGASGGQRIGKRKKNRKKNF